MGQQQLLLIVLGIIIVGIAIYLGIQVFWSNDTQTNRDAVIHDLQNVAFRAQAYFRLPTSLAGGGSSFVGFQIPNGMFSTINGVYTVTNATETNCTVEAEGREIGDDGVNKLKYTVTIDEHGIITLVQNN